MGISELAQKWATEVMGRLTFLDLGSEDGEHAFIGVTPTGIEVVSIVIIPDQSVFHIMDINTGRTLLSTKDVNQSCLMELVA